MERGFPDRLKRAPLPARELLTFSLPFAIRGDIEHQEKPYIRRSLRFANIENHYVLQRLNKEESRVARQIA